MDSIASQFSDSVTRSKFVHICGQISWVCQGSNWCHRIISKNLVRTFITTVIFQKIHQHVTERIASLLSNLHHHLCSLYLWSRCLKIFSGGCWDSRLSALYLLMKEEWKKSKTSGNTWKLKVLLSFETYPESYPLKTSDKLLDTTDNEFQSKVGLH